MLELIKGAMTLGNMMSGYKTYLAAMFIIMNALGGWGVQVFMPFIDGGMSLGVFYELSQPYFAQISAGFGFAFVRSGISK